MNVQSCRTFDNSVSSVIPCQIPVRKLTKEENIKQCGNNDQRIQYLGHRTIQCVTAVQFAHNVAQDLV
ncbi:unnamed protein product [Cercopithifilaria johnstoni]|uniref:Uncharacterized protein n=1 Tax=Cercopithifilaria johnstoni TaxID=2874296 RepID=A0A8J2Q765_9BILA|nr:unnamed protein product [Cercopithifilaria johnstoni]